MDRRPDRPPTPSRSSLLYSEAPPKTRMIVFACAFVVAAVVAAIAGAGAAALAVGLIAGGVASLGVEQIWRAGHRRPRR